MRRGIMIGGFTYLFFVALFLAGIAFSAQGDEASAQRTPLEEFRKLLKNNAIVVVDVRSHEAYAQGHIPGAISIPFAAIASHAEELKKAGKPIVTYCS